MTERYLFGPGVVNGAVMTAILARTSSGGTTAWYLTDKLGSVRDIVDTSGNELDHIVYDSFGNIVTETNAANGDRFKFAGMQYDATVGQYYDHARALLRPRERSQAPTRRAFWAGQRLRSYVGSDPTNATDPTGELQIPAPTSPAPVVLQFPAWLPPPQLLTDQELLDLLEQWELATGRNWSTPD